MIQPAKTNNRLFEGIDTSGMTPEQMNNAKKLYNYIVESAEIAKENGTSIDDVLDEGIFGSLIGGVVGASVGKSIMEGVVKVLGIDPNGTLGKLLTSQVVLGALGAYCGYNW